MNDRETSKGLQGWRAIAAYVAARTGFTVNVDSVQRWARRAKDPLPVKRWGLDRPRVVADRAALDAWITRQWRDGANEAVASRASGERGDGSNG